MGGEQRDSEGYRRVGARPSADMRVRPLQMAHRPDHARNGEEGEYAGRAMGVRPVVNHVRRTLDEQGRQKLPGSPRILAVVVALALALVALGVGYMTHWRTVEVTVNGTTVPVRVDAKVDALMADHKDFGVKPGRLLSVGGKVLDARGGVRAAVTVNGAEVPMHAWGSTGLPAGAVITVKNGPDATEDHTVEQQKLKPGVQMGKGGAIQFVEKWGYDGAKEIWHGKRSGETVDKRVVKPAQDLVIASKNVHPADGGKYIAITFDDGPSEYTSQVLAILKQKGAHATFFNLGNESAGFPDLTRQVVADGHELGSHTNTHQFLPKLDREALRNEITSASDTLRKNSGKEVRIIRSPYGAFDADCWKRSADLISCNVIWNIDTLDWKRPGADAIKNNVLSNAYNGAIVLMHDGGGNREQDVQALPGIIDGLHQAGYKLVTVQELMRTDPQVFPKDMVDGTVKMPKGAVLPE